MGLTEKAQPEDIKQLYEKQVKIKDLKHQRFYLRDKIRGRLKKGYDKAYVKSDIIKFNEIIQQLLDLGVDTWIECDYLKLENYKDVEAKQKPKIKKSKIFKEEVVKKQKPVKNKQPSKSLSKQVADTIPTEIKIPNKVIQSDKSVENNYYILNLAWTEKLSDNIDYTSITNIVNDYFKKVGAKILTNELELFNVGEGLENHIMKYEIQCDDNCFKLIKSSAQYLLDILNENNCYDIAVYGKKRNY